MQCGACSADLIADARFCAACGARVPDEDPAAVAVYQDALRTLGHRSEAWAHAELASLREELSIRPSTHDRLLAALTHDRPAAAPIGAWIDTAPMADFRAGGQCLIRVRVVNEGARALRSVMLQLEASGQELTAQTRDLLGPGDHTVLSVVLKTEVAGHHQLTGALLTRGLRGDEGRWALAPVGFRVGAAGALQQSIHIDARSQRVGIFENIGVSDRGGFVGDGDWRRLDVVAAPDGPPDAPRAPSPSTLPVGHRGTATVRAVEDQVVLELDGQRGALVELSDPALRQILRPGDSLRVTVIGTDGAGGLLLSDRSADPAPEPAAAPSSTVGPGDDLAAAVRQAPAGAEISVTGVHAGPIRVDRPLTLLGDGRIEARRGAALRITADAVVRGLTIVGAAPPGAYAPDGIEVHAGRVVLDGCDIRSDTDGNLTPGRGVAVVGRATVELTDCAVHHCGVGIAVDVGWGGFPTEDAAGARVRAVRCHLRDNALAVGVAGAGREAHLEACRFERNADGSVRILGGATARLDGCDLPEGSATAEAGSTLSIRRGGP